MNKNSYQPKTSDKHHLNDGYRLNRFDQPTNNELVKVIKNADWFPQQLSQPIPLERLVAMYNKYWTHDLSDESSSSS